MEDKLGNTINPGDYVAYSRKTARRSSVELRIAKVISVSGDSCRIRAVNEDNRFDVKLAWRPTNLKTPRRVVRLPSVPAKYERLFPKETD